MDSVNPNRKIKITELPIYTSCCKNKQASTTRQESANIIEPYISDLRKEIESFVGPQFGDSFKRFGEILATSKAHTYDLIETVRDDRNAAARATFITSAAFVGYLLGRRGFIRRTLMATIAAGTAAAICEPKMARDYVEVSFELTKRKISETYNDYGGPDLMKNIHLPDFGSLFNGNKSSSSATTTAAANDKQQ